MECRAAALVLLVLCAFIFTFSEGYIPNCCLNTSKRISYRVSKRITRYDVQTDTGSCDIKALILHVGKERLCIDPQLEKKVQRILKYNKKRERLQRMHGGMQDE
ncbi:C-C motif chemokine 27a [Trichomycterus rosablanca]|uniref:C-C motif chemokine 27a n=1 Tax=Trichomycterus rosablanca TaxID=2290929 RepID=UPI002F359167